MSELFPNIGFAAEGHRYFVKDGRAIDFTSVTGVVSKLTPPFRSRYWATYKSLKNNEPEDIKSDASPHVPRDYIRLDGRLYHYEELYSDACDELLLEWEEKANTGKATGSMVHANLENMGNGLPVTTACPAANRYRLEMPDTLYTELIVADEELGIAGQVDHISTDWVMTDYKTDKKIRKDNPFESLLPPLEDMPNCELSKYTLQLNLYTYIIEKNSTHRVREMRIVHFPDPLEESYEIIPIERITHRIEDIIEYYYANPGSDIHAAGSDGITW